MGTHVYLWVKYFKNVLKYKYQSIITYIYLSTSTQVHEQYLSTVLKYSSSLDNNESGGLRTMHDTGLYFCWKPVQIESHGEEEPNKPQREQATNGIALDLCLISMRCVMGILTSSFVFTQSIDTVCYWLSQDLSREVTQTKRSGEWVAMTSYWASDSLHFRSRVCL